VSFKGILGHEAVVSFLIQAIKNDKVAHAYIFKGPSGIGKASIAVNFAKALNCGIASDDIPCGGCPSCKKIDSGNHPDVAVIKPAADGDTIGIDDIRAVIKDAALKPYEGRKKVYIIDGADSMTLEAQGALLKTMEEPSSETVIILVGDNTEGLLPTIVSRGEVVRFLPLKKDEVREALIKSYGVDIARAHVLAGLYPGRLGEALRRSSDEGFFEKRSVLLDSLMDGKIPEPGNEKKSRQDIMSELDIMLTWFRDILVTKIDPNNSADIINVDRKESITGEASRLEFGYLDRVLKEIMATGSYLDSNANPKLALGVLGMEIGS